MARHRTGAAIQKWKEKNGKRVRQWYACVSYWEEGKRRQWVQKPKHNTKTAARELAKMMLGEMSEQGSKAIDASSMTFAELADYYQQTYLVDPEYVCGRKVAGLRNKYDFENRLKALRYFFRTQRIKSITHSDLEKYRTTRLKTPVIVGRNTRGTDAPGNPTTRERSIATVNRELSLLRRIFNVAVSNGWLLRNPFAMGKSLINPGDEQPRERILSKDEEERLLAACTGERAHLRPIIICALDTGMRRGEMFKLTWPDIDFANEKITIRALNTKILRERGVAMTQRLKRALESMYLTRQNDGLVFGITTSPKTSFNKVKKAANIPDLRFHDLRHTNATRLVAQHMPLSEVGRLLGHTPANTTFRYVNANIETARRAAALIDEFNEYVEETDEVVIN